MLLLKYCMIFLIGVSRGQCECPNGWVRYQASCYLFSHIKLNFHDAENFCHQEGGYLTHIETRTENNFIRNYCKDLQVARRWIGMTDQVVENDWVWHGTKTLPSFFDWGPQQPDHGYNANCGALWEAYSYQWCDEPCGKLYEPICERSLSYDVQVIG